jgi:3-hydroxyisobutyrate dehydrogenase-like beta-hydroxyacid dehydrogenase
MIMALEIGIVGLGRMGTEIAANLVSEGRQVMAYIRRSQNVWTNTATF